MFIQINKSPNWDLGAEVTSHLLEIDADGKVLRLIQVDGVDHIVGISPSEQNPYGALDYPPLSMESDWSEWEISPDKFEAYLNREIGLRTDVMSLPPCSYAPDRRLQMIRDLHDFTEVGLSDCKKALDIADGDHFQALCSLLTPEAFHEKDRAFQVRFSCGNSILNPVTKEEARLMDSLRAYFDSLSVRPHHSYFSTHVLPRLLFSQPDNFTRLVSSTAQSWLSHAWTLCGNELEEEYRLDPDGLSVSSVPLDDSRQAAVIVMPQTQSDHEVDFIVLCEMPKRFRLLGKKYPIRYFFVSELMSTPQRNIVVVHECFPKGDDFVIKKHFDRENVKTSSESVAALVDGIR